MPEAGRIGLLQNDGTILSVPLHKDACVCHAGYLLCEFFNTEDKIRELIHKGAIAILTDCVDTTVYDENIKLLTVSYDLDEYIEKCQQERVDFGYLYDGISWKIVCGLCVGELQRKV